MADHGDNQRQERDPEQGRDGVGIGAGDQSCDRYLEPQFKGGNRMPGESMR